MSRLATIALVRPEIRRKNLSIEANLKQIEPLFERFGSSPVDIACLPEDFASVCENAQPDDGTVGAFLSRMAKGYRMHLLGGLSEISPSCRSNRTLLFDPAGKLAGRYRKIHLTKIEREVFKLSPGDEVPVLEAGNARIDVMVCFDSYFPELAGIMARRGADIIFHPNQFNVPYESYAVRQLQVRAQDNCVYVASTTWGVAPGTPWTNEMGCYASLIIDRDGEVLARSSHDAGVLQAMLDLDRRYVVRHNVETGDHDFSGILLKYRRPDIYRKMEG